MDVVDYGRGKPKWRRPSWLAVVAVLIPCILWLLAWGTYVIYKSPPPPYSGVDAPIGWAFGVGAAFVFLLIGTYLGTPLSVILAVSALIAIRRRPDRLVGRMVAVLAILMSIALFAVVVSTVQRKVDRESAESEASEAAWQKSYRDRVNAVTSELERLLDDCQLYARAHAGNYPADVEALRRWISETNPGAVPDFSQFLYFGADLTDHTVAPSQQVPVYGPDNPLIVWVRRPDTRYSDYLIGTTMGHGGRTKSVPSVNIRLYLDGCNKERATMGLPPITENDIAR